MFENTSDHDIDDDFLETSFASVFSSTQVDAKQSDPKFSNSKRQSENEKSSKTLEIRVGACRDVKERLQTDDCLFKENSNVIIDAPRKLEHSNRDNTKNCNSTFSSPPKALKRKFPGPAGLLPDKNCTKSFSESIQDGSQQDLFLCSQRTLKSFEDGPWNEMMKDFGATGSGALYEKFNINWIKRNCSAKKLLKGPFLAAVIQSVEIIHGNMATINILLKDTTGEIEGSILNSLYGEKSQLFTSGSVIVLKDFGVLTVRNNHCLTITPNSLLVIYHLEKDIDGNPVSVEKNVMQKFNLHDIWTQTQTQVDVPKAMNQATSCSNEAQLGITRQNSMNPCGSKEYSEFSFKVAETRNIAYTEKNAVTSENSSSRGARCEDNASLCSQEVDHAEKQVDFLKDLFENVDPKLLFDEF